MFLFDKDGYLKPRIPEETLKEIVRKYSEQQEMKKIFNNCLKIERRSMLDVARACFPIQELGPGALPIYDREVIFSKEIPPGCISGYCGEDTDCKECYDSKMRVQFAADNSHTMKIHHADTTDYEITPTACEGDVVTLPQDIKWSSNMAKVTCDDCLAALSTIPPVQQIADEEDERIKKILNAVDLEGATSAVAPTQKQHHEHGMNCKKCNVLNKYVIEANQPDGSYLCYSCRA